MFPLWNRQTMISNSEVLENVLTLDFVGFFCFLKYRFSLHIVGFDNTLPPSCLMRPGLGTRTVWHLCLLCGWSAGMFTQSVFGVTVGLCGVVFLFNALPDGAVLKRRETSPSPVASSCSSDRGCCSCNRKQMVCHFVRQRSRS